MKCRYGTMPHPEYTRDDWKRSLHSISGNILLDANGDGTFVDRSREAGFHITGGSWSARFADFDDDEWQDLYVVNGVVLTRRRSNNLRESNMYFRNIDGKSFVDETDEAGLVSYLRSGSYVSIDIENDGDLDLVPFHGPLIVYRNDSIRGEAIEFELRDAVGNSHGIGSKLTIHYGEEAQRHQLREIKSGGGFVSFDPLIAHFGLAEYTEIERVEIEWSTGERDVLCGPFSSGARYRVTRKTVSSPVQLAEVPR